MMRAALVAVCPGMPIVVVPKIVTGPPKEEVEVVVPVKNDATTCPTTESVEYGLDVPIPMFPLAFTLKSDVVAEPFEPVVDAMSKRPI
jgi:hypothetical protein